MDHVRTPSKFFKTLILRDCPLFLVKNCIFFDFFPNLTIFVMFFFKNGTKNIREKYQENLLFSKKSWKNLSFLLQKSNFLHFIEEKFQFSKIFLTNFYRNIGHLRELHHAPCEHYCSKSRSQFSILLLKIKIYKMHLTAL